MICAKSEFLCPSARARELTPHNMAEVESVPYWLIATPITSGYGPQDDWNSTFLHPRARATLGPVRGGDGWPANQARTHIHVFRAEGMHCTPGAIAAPRVGGRVVARALGTLVSSRRRAVCPR
jgi:hypothetical protein